MDAKKEKRIRIGTLAFGIAFMPPIWAVLSTYIGVTTGAVALICAGLYVANGNKRSDAFKIAGRISVWRCVGSAGSMDYGNIPIQSRCRIILYIVYFRRRLAVLIGENVPKYIFTPSWLCGWAIGLTIMGPLKVSEIGTLPIQIGAAMIAGVVYVGIGVDALQKFLIKKLS